MTMPSDHHAQRLSDNPGAQLALLTTAVIMLIAIGWFYSVSLAVAASVRRPLLSARPIATGR
jgi:hypothetical protein